MIDENAPTPEKMQSKVWISILKLYSSDKDDLEMVESCLMLSLMQLRLF